jgi:metallo-beta-lactamase family protein
VLNFKDSMAISNYRQPSIIISSSGMITGGRIQHHIQKNINNPYCTILTIGYSADGTPGAQLKANQHSIKLGSKNIPIAAKIVNTDVFSGHADQNDLIELIESQDKNSIQKIFLVHGEPESMQCLQDIMKEKGYHQIEIPPRGKTYIL